MARTGKGRGNRRKEMGKQRKKGILTGAVCPLGPSPSLPSSASGVAQSEPTPPVPRCATATTGIGPRSLRTSRGAGRARRHAHTEAHIRLHIHTSARPDTDTHAHTLNPLFFLTVLRRSKGSSGDGILCCTEMSSNLPRAASHLPLTWRPSALSMCPQAPNADPKVDTMF